MPKRDNHDLARRLLAKARGDEAALERIAGAPDVPDEVIGFHAQQAVEKLLKAVLAHHGIDYPRTHDIAFLLRLTRENRIPEPPDERALRALTPWAAEFRYEDAFGHALDRSAALSLVRRVARWAEGLLEGG